MWRRLTPLCLGLFALAISTQASFAQGHERRGGGDGGGERRGAGPERVEERRGPQDAGYERRWRHERERWELLGSRQVGFVTDRDTIRVGSEKGKYQQILLVVQKADIHLDSITVVFGNGQRQMIRVDDNLRDGERTRTLDLQGESRWIDRIEMIYRSRPSFKGQAIVEVYGEKARGPGLAPHPGGHWVDLGCQKVGFGADHDVIELGAREDRYRALRIGVRGTAVELRRVRVTFRGGETYDVARPQKIHSGNFSDRMDLPGDHARRVMRIDLDYSSKLSFKGEATACVQGQQ